MPRAFEGYVEVPADKAQDAVNVEIPRDVLHALGFSTGDNVRHYALPIAFPIGVRPTFLDLYHYLEKQAVEHERERVIERVRDVLFAP